MNEQTRTAGTNLCASVIAFASGGIRSYSRLLGENPPTNPAAVRDLHFLVFHFVHSCLESTRCLFARLLGTERVMGKGLRTVSYRVRVDAVAVAKIHRCRNRCQNRLSRGTSCWRVVLGTPGAVMNRRVGTRARRPNRNYVRTRTRQNSGTPFRRCAGITSLFR